MENELFPQFAPLIRAMSTDELEGEIRAPAKLRPLTAQYRGKTIDISYAPFDFVNLAARLVIVGLTPGRQQMRNALYEARRLLVAGASIEAAAQAAKVYASFSGSMRTNLV
ncbi:MAG: hypothetical protein ACREFQ_16855, partial [Stellaceae bacterium]